MNVLLGALAAGRSRANARMTEIVRVGTLVEGIDPDPVTLDPIVTFDVVYGEDGDGIARLKFPGSSEVEVLVAGQPVVKQDLDLHLPSGTPGITPDMRAVVDSSTADPSLVGRVFRIKALPHAGQTTAARFTVEETGETIPEGS